MAKERSSFFHKFNSEFEENLPKTKSYQEAFNVVANRFQDVLGASPYGSWDSFKSQRSKRRHK